MIVSAKKAAELIRTGDVVGLPTETVYGLAADASNIIAVEKIFGLKQRPVDNPLIVHVSDVNQTSVLADTNSEGFERLIDAFWPGPLTVVLPKKPQVLDIITAGLNTVAVRMPDHSDMLQVIDSSGPLAAPSANRSGRPSPTCPQHVEDDFGKDFPVVDGGSCAIGLESTVLDLSDDMPTILRPGQITAEQIESVLKKTIIQQPPSSIELRRSPGTRYSHYKPKAKVEWMGLTSSTHTKRPDTLYVYHTLPIEIIEDNTIHFKGDFKKLARSLYDLYRTADKKKFTSIIIEPLPEVSISPILPALQNRIERSVYQ